MKRCAWAPLDNASYLAYHDEEWGVPVHDDRLLFEMLTLEGAQAGLSWSTILNKREGYRRAFADFDPGAVARFSGRKVDRLLADPSIVRNRLKVESTVANAREVLRVQEEEGSLDAYLWSFVGGAPKVNRYRTLGDIPAETAESTAMSKDLKRRGFRFVGPTVCYAFMQACGLVNDHVVGCFRYREVARVRRVLLIVAALRPRRPPSPSAAGSSVRAKRSQAVSAADAVPRTSRSHQCIHSWQYENRSTSSGVRNVMPSVSQMKRGRVPFPLVLRFAP